MQIAQCRAVSYGAIDQNATAGDNNGCPRLILAARVALSRPGDSYQRHVCGDPEVIGEDSGERAELPLTTTRTIVCRCSKASYLRVRVTTSKQRRVQILEYKHQGIWFLNVM